VSEVDALKLYRSANAFVNPRAFAGSARQTNPYLRQAVAVTLLVVAVGLGLALGYQLGRTSVKTSTLVVQAAPGRQITKFTAQMLSNQSISGPFTMNELAQMKADGKVPADAMFRTQGNAEWVSYQDLPWPVELTASRSSTP
jgi:hypothetical protein